MAKVKNYGLEGVSRSVQLGKQGPKIQGNADTYAFKFTAEDGTTLSRVEGANAVSSNEFVTKAQLDVVKNAEATYTTTVTHNGGNENLGIIPAGTKTVITTLNVNTPFNGTATVTIGTDSSPNALLGGNYNDISVAGSFQTITTQTFLTDTQVRAFVPGSNATQGSAVVVVSYY